MKPTKLDFATMAILVLITSCKDAEKSAPKVSGTPLYEEQLRAKGKYLSVVGGCNDCHSPKIMTPEGPIPDTTRLLSGHPANELLPATPTDRAWVYFNPTNTAFAGPWGISFGANLTPDVTGIGNWTVDQFKTALRKGKYKGLETTRPLLPPMPWQNYGHMTDQDIEALFAYLKSIPPVKNLVPAAVPSTQGRDK